MLAYYLPDGQGSVRALADSSGSITDRYRYDAFGNVVSSQGTTVNPYGYDGQRLDAQTGLYQLRARSYDPSNGRFLSRDTAAVQLSSPTELNCYVYAHDDPVNFADPSGHGTDLDEYVQIVKQDTQQAQKELVPVATAIVIVIVLAIVIALIIVILGSHSGSPPPPPPQPTPKRPNMMRVQLLQQ